MDSRKQNDSSAKTISILMVDATDKETAETGLTPTVNISKNGGSFVSASGPVAEVGNGMYKYTPDSTDLNTLGPLVLIATGTGALTFRKEINVVAYDQFNLLEVKSRQYWNNGTSTYENYPDKFHTLNIDDATGSMRARTTGDAAIAPASTALSTAQWTNSRAAFLDNLNVGGAVGSQADINALNQSASRRVVLSTVPQYERPESGTTTYQLELRTYDGDGAATNADSTPTITATGITSGSLAANLSSVSNITTGVYRATYTVSNSATLEQIRFDASATIASATFTIAAFAQVCDFVAATWTSTNATWLQAIYDKLPSGNLVDDAAVITAAESALTSYGAALQTDLAALAAKFSGITSVLKVLAAIARKTNNDATAVSELNTNFGSGAGSFNPATDSGEAIADAGGAGGVTLAADALDLLPGLKLLNGSVIPGTVVDDTDNSTTSFLTDLMGDADYKWQSLIFQPDTTTASLRSLKRNILAHDNLTGVITIDEPLPDLPADGDTFGLVGYQTRRR